MAIAKRTIFAWQRKQLKGEGVEHIFPGAVTLIHNTGSALNLHYHAHAVVLDGVFDGNKVEELAFIELIPSIKHIEEILKKIICKVNRALISYQEEHADDEPSPYDHLLFEAVQESLSSEPSPQRQFLSFQQSYMEPIY